ncbi:31639_t:CDS:2, partial [Racocetra persica]
MADTANQIKINVLLNSKPKAENLLRQFAAAFNIPYTNHRVVRAKLQKEYEKRVFPPINNRIMGEMRTRLQRRDKEHRRRMQEQQRINTCHDIIEGKSKPETDLPSGFEMDNDGNNNQLIENTENRPKTNDGVLIAEI